MNTEVKSTAQILPSVLTEASEQPTKERPVSIEDWAKWLKLETCGDPQLVELVRVCARWARLFKAFADYESDTPITASWISLIGKTGTGKTHCATRLWEWAQSKFQWHRCEFAHRPIYWPALVRDLRNQQRYDELRELSKWPVLMLDDIGAERDTTGFASEQLNTLLGCRVGRWTILTSNLNLEQLAAIDPRIADRIIREPGNQYIDVDTVSFGVRRAA